MKALGLCLCLVMCMGVSCEPPPVPVTVSVQYVNNTGNNIRFDVIDATNKTVDIHSMVARTPFNPADPVSTITGILPFTVTTPFYADNPNLSCSIPSIIGINPSYAQLTTSVAGKIVRIEATALSTLECVEE